MLTTEHKMKKIAFTLFSCAIALCSVAQKTTIELPAPDKTLKMTLMEALQQRHSTWTHTSKPVSDEELSTILWAASGINRPESGRLTAPSAINAQDIQVYVMRKEGTYLYNVKKHQLDKVNDKDLREAVCGRDAKPKTAPIMLLLVSNMDKFGNRSDEAKRTMATVDAGYVSQNICLACTALGLNTVPRLTMDKPTLVKELELSDSQMPLIDHPISKP